MGTVALLEREAPPPREGLVLPPVRANVPDNEEEEDELLLTLLLLNALLLYNIGNDKINHQIYTHKNNEYGPKNI